MSRFFQEELNTFRQSREDASVLPWIGKPSFKHYVAGPYKDALDNESYGDDENLWLENGTLGVSLYRSDSFPRGVTHYKGQLLSLGE